MGRNKSRVKGVDSKTTIGHATYMEMKQINGFGGQYWITDTGKLIKKTNKGDYERRGFTVNGYAAYTIKYKGKTTSMLAHRLVAQYFIQDDISGMQVHHKNDIKTDNRVENLAVVTQGNHLAIHRARSRYIKIMRWREQGRSLSQIANMLGITKQRVAGIIAKNTVKGVDTESIPMA